MITYTSDKPSGITRNGVVLVKGDTIDFPQSLIDSCLAAGGWEDLAAKPAPKPKRTAKKDK